MSLSIIVATATNRVIGSNGSMPWKLPADLRRFKALTVGKAVIMGRKTYESLPIKPLPGRLNIIVSRNKELEADDCLVVGSLEEAVSSAPSPELFVMGGGEIYEQALPLADKVYRTAVDMEPKGDVFFPELNLQEWKLESSESGFDSQQSISYRFEIYRRIAERREL